MSSTTELSPQQAKGNRMEENWLWYLSGVVDSLANFHAKIKKDTRYEYDYIITPSVDISRPVTHEAVFGMMDEYAEANSVKYRLEDTTTNKRFVVSNPDSIERFLEPLMGGFIQQREAAEILVDSFIPRYREYEEPSREEFIELAELRDELREYNARSKQSKYDTDYFRDLWEDELQ